MKPHLAHDETPEQAVERLARTVALLEERLALLEKENRELADLLRERGVDVRAGSAVALELPAPLVAPAARNEEILALMPPAARKLLLDVAGRGPLLLVLRSDSLVDVGRWLGRGRVWVGVTAGELTLVAAGPRAVAQKTPLTSLRRSLYNHVTGALLLAPNQDLKIGQVVLPPLDAVQVLAQIYGAK